MFDIGDALLFALSAWRQCSWRSFRRAFDDLYIRSLATSGTIEEPGSIVRRNAARALDALGHCEVIFGTGSNSLFAAPSVLAQLPAAGLPRAVLCGSRSPDSLRALRDAAGRVGPSLQVQAASQVSINRFAPARIEVQATSEAAMSRLAQDVGLAYEAVPPAWSLVSVSGSLDRFMESLAWSQRPALNWVSTDFDPDQVRFSGGSTSGVDLILRRYQDPVRGGWLFWLWLGGHCAEIDDPSWGRYAVLAALGRTVLRYDAASGELSVPAGVPLPRLLSRAMTLCSGYAAAMVAEPARVAGGVPRRYAVYRGVPPDVLRVCAEKLGQATGDELNGDGSDK